MSFMNSSTILVAMLLPRKRVFGSEVTETSCSMSLFSNCSSWWKEIEKGIEWGGGGGGGGGERV